MATVNITREAADEAVNVLQEQIDSWQSYLSKYSGEDEENILNPAIEYLRHVIAALQADKVEIQELDRTNRANNLMFRRPIDTRKR